MDQNMRDADMDADLYLSLYGKNENTEPQKIKAYVLYKQFTENARNHDNLVVATDDTNEISVSFNGRSDCKVFSFDKVFYSDISQIELFDSLAKSIIQDVIIGLNCFLFVCNLASPCITKPFEGKIPFPEMAFIESLTQNILKELFLHTKNEENEDSSLLASFFGVCDNRIVDFLSNCIESTDLKIFKIPNQNCIEIKDLVEKPLIDENDISELLTKQHSHCLICYANCCHSILSVSLVNKNVNCDGFELLKVGKLTVIDFAKGRNILEASKILEDCVLKFTENSEFPTSPKGKIFDILRPAFGGNAKTSIIVTLSAMMYFPEKDLNILQFVSQAQKVFNYPETTLKLIIPISLKEYSEEIQELQKDFNAVSKGTGIKIDNLMYRSFKNCITLENEKVKSLSNFLKILTDSINAKKQNLINLHGTTEAMKCEIKEIEKCSENLKFNFKKMKDENNVKQKVSIKADEIIAMKRKKNTNDINFKKLKSELLKVNRNCNELMHGCDCLKSDIVSLSYDINDEQTCLKSTLDLLMDDMNSALTDFQTLHEDLFKKLYNLSSIDVLLNTWRHNTENLLSKLSSFIDEHNRIFSSIKFNIGCSLVPLQASQNEIIEIIGNNRSEKWPVLSYYFHKIQIFCDSSFKILAEIIYQLDLIQNCYKTELKVISSVIFSSSEAFKKFICDISNTLKSSQQYFEEQENELKQMTDLVYFHQKFKKHFDESINEIKSSLLALKQTCLSHNDLATSKWNEIQKDCLKSSQKHADLSDNLFLIHKETSKYMDKLVQQKVNGSEHSQLKDKTENIESRTQQLLHLHKEMKAVAEIALELNKKGTDKELQELREFMNSQKFNVEKYFHSYSLRVKANSSSFLDELKNIQRACKNNKEEMKKYLDFLSASISSLPTIYDNYQSASSNILMKSRDALKVLPVTNADTNDNMPNFESIILDEWQVSSSTPIINEKKILNVSYEKEKILNRIKSVVEQQMSQKLNIAYLDTDGKERKDHNTSTMSLPNLSTHSKAYHMMGKNYLKFNKKQT